MTSKITLYREALDRLSAPAVAAMLDRGWLAGHPLELTKRGKVELRVVSTDRGRKFVIVRAPRGTMPARLRARPAE